MYGSVCVCLRVSASDKGPSDVFPITYLELDPGYHAVAVSKDPAWGRLGHGVKCETSYTEFKSQLVTSDAC